MKNISYIHDTNTCFLQCVFRCVILQTLFRCKPFVTHCTHIRPWLVIMWIITDIFNLDLKLTPCICTMLQIINVYVNNYIYKSHIIGGDTHTAWAAIAVPLQILGELPHTKCCPNSDDVHYCHNGAPK